MANETLPVARPRWLGVARVAWVVVAAAELVVFAASVPAYWLQLNTLCTEPSRQDCNFTQLTPVMHDAVERWGLTVGAYATYTLAIHVAASLTLLTVGVLVFWRGPQGWYGLFVSLLLVTFGTIGPSAVLNRRLRMEHTPSCGDAYRACSPGLCFRGLACFSLPSPMAASFRDGASSSSCSG